MKESRWKSFLGGNDTIFTLVIGILVGIFLLLLQQLDFIFNPIIVIISSILMPFVISLLLYYLFNPIVDFMENHKVKRIWAVAILYVAVVLLLAGLIAVLYPLLEQQFTSLVESIPDIVDSISEWFMGVINMFSGTALEDMITEIESFLSDTASDITQYITQGLSGITSLISSITSTVITIVTVPIILFFLLKDDQKFFNGFLRIMPPKWRQDLMRMGARINVQVGSYIKGQLTVAVVNGTMMFLGFLLIGLNYSGVLGIAGGFLSIIPYLGPTLTFIPALIIALLDSWVRVALLIGVWIVIQFVEGNFVEPNVMGRQLKIHPLTIIVVLIIMGDLLGIFGLIFGIPIYAIIKVIVTHFFQKFKIRYNRLYGDVSGKYNADNLDHIDFSDDNIEEAKVKVIRSITNQDEKTETKNN